MSEPSKDLHKDGSLVPAKTSNRVGFHNQANIKAAGRGIILEALTAFKGGKVGKRGLLVRAMDELAKAFDEKEAENNPEFNILVRGRKQWAIEQVLKLANAMTKDDKANPLEEMLKGAANVQINFNTHFSQRSASDQPDQGLTIGFSQAEGLTPPPGSGA